MAVTNDAEKIIVSGDKISFKEVLAHATIGVITGRLAGAAGGAVANVFRGLGAVGQAADKVSSKAKQVLSKMNPCALVEQTSLAVMGSASTLLEERIDDSQENKPCIDHVKRTIVKVAKTVAKQGVNSAVKTTWKAVNSATQSKTYGCKDANIDENIEEDVDKETDETTGDNERENEVEEALNEREEFGNEKSTEERNENEGDGGEAMLDIVLFN